MLNLYRTRNPLLLHATAFLAFALIFFAGCRKEELGPLAYPTKSLNIKELEIRTKDLQEARNFWEGNLGFEVISATPGSVTFQIGESRLTFKNQVTIDPPIYHFAIEIPSNQVENAYEWLRNEGGTYPDGPQNPVSILRAEPSGADISYRPLYKARSVFFRDPNGQIIELIGREDANNREEGVFNRSMMKRICDFSLITRDVRQTVTMFQEEFGVEAFEGTTSSYKPVGGPTGTLSLIIPGRPFLPTESIESFPYDAVLYLQHPEEKEILVPGSEVYIRTEP